MMAETIVDRLYKEIKELQKFLEEQSEISFATFSDSNFRKSLLLSSASFFEKEIKRIIEEFTNEKTQNNFALIAFLKNKAIARQYHTFFNWNDNNANSFFGLFGSDFKEHMKKLIKADDEINKYVKAFLEIGKERNRLVHQDFGNFTLEKTTDEIFDLHSKAVKFVEIFETEIKENG